jgi:hypothetical protein
LTTYLNFEKEAEASRFSYAIIPIRYPIGRFVPVRRVAIVDVVYEDRWGQPCRDG